MTVNIDCIRPHAHPHAPTHTMGNAPVHCGFTISGVTDDTQQNVHVYFETPVDGLQSANRPTVSDAQGQWSAAFPGPIAAGTKITAFARSAAGELARYTKVI